MKKYLLLIALFLVVGVVVTPTAHAARLQTIGNELFSTTANVEYSLNGLFGTPDGISTTQVNTGNYSLYFGQTAAAQFSWMAYKFRATATTATTTVGAMVYLNSTFSAAQELISLSSEGPGQQASLRLNASNQLCLFDVTPAQVGSCTTITTGAWHDIEISTNGTTNLFGYLDGVVFASVTTGTPVNAISRFYLGAAFSASAKSDTYFDDIFVNDGTGSNQTWWRGSAKDVLYQPTGAGDNNTMYTSTPGVGTTNNWNLVNVLPVQTTKFVLGTTTAQGTDSYTVNATTTAKAVPAGSTINLVQVGARFVGAATSNATFKLQIKASAAGTVASSTAIAPTSTLAVSYATTSPYNAVFVNYTDPSGSAWTPTTISTMQIGQGITVANANFAKIYNVWAYVEYVAGAASGPTTAQKGYIRTGLFNITKGLLSI